MQLALEREILRLQPDLTVEQVKEKAIDIASYWTYECLPDVLEAEA